MIIKVDAFLDDDDRMLRQLNYPEEPIPALTYQLHSSAASYSRNSNTHWKVSVLNRVLFDLKVASFCSVVDQMSGMASHVGPSGEPITTSSVLMASSKHIGSRCHSENVAFLKCKKKDPNPEKCLDNGREVTRCVLGLLKDIHQKCTKQMDDYVGCMYYYTNEFDMCRKEQEAFEKACPLE
ncbi:hypothetical protein SAY87_023719 [Trapa incisa]|uniref:CHCH domain-containing protein n=2 Tax=Trapa TaxID=22665 RepID=A0AAN7QUI4_9MYRT|nr:hypothetical protein SAY87_023719 [Trapa incisa]